MAVTAQEQRRIRNRRRHWAQFGMEPPGGDSMSTWPRWIVQMWNVDGWRRHQNVTGHDLERVTS